MLVTETSRIKRSDGVSNTNADYIFKETISTQVDKEGAGGASGIAPVPTKILRLDSKKIWNHLMLSFFLHHSQ